MTHTMGTKLQRNDFFYTFANITSNDFTTMTLPDDFITSTRRLMGDSLFDTLVCGLEAQPIVSIRLNGLKCDPEHTAVSGGGRVVPWCREGRYLDIRPNFTFDPLLHAGVYYVQEASSMFVSHVVRSVVDLPVTMLDLCAAPGGKSIAVREALPSGSLLISNEPIRNRANILAENLQKQGHRDVIVTNNYPRDFRRSGVTFDVVLADVPCSGEGMFRKDDGAVADWSMKKVEACSQLQRDIVSDIWPCLRPGGYLIYSTCTFNSLEDEQNVEWIVRTLGATLIDVPAEKSWNITPALGCDIPAYRFLPGKTEGEGLFMAVLRKNGTAEATTVSKPENKKRKERKQFKEDIPAIEIPLNDSARYVLRRKDDVTRAVPRAWAAVYDAVSKSLNVLHAGVELYREKGHNMLPCQSLALSAETDLSRFVCRETDYATAIAYLRNEAVRLPEDTPRGIVLLTWMGHPLGFVKNLGNRANNLYPTEWKIKSTHAPQTPEQIIIEPTIEK